MCNIKEIKKCQYCGHKEFTTFLDFGLSPLANSLKETENQQEFVAPLEVVKCENPKCSGFQLKHLVKPEVLFSNYSYRSSQGLEKHFQDYAKHVYSLLGLQRGDLMLGIGGNVGFLEKAFDNLGLSAINVEPAQNIAFESRENNVNTINSYFDHTIGKQLKSKAKIICANNVMAHCNLGPVIEGIKQNLDKDGYFIMENAYWLDSTRQSDFFQIYSEHYKYLSIKPLVNLFNIQGFDVFRVEYNQIQCGTIRVFVKWKKNKIFEIDNSVGEAIKNEEEFGLYKKETYDLAIKRLDGIKEELVEELKKIKESEKKIGLFGVAAKTVLMLKYFGIADYISLATDDSNLKWQKFIPGTNVKIVSKDEFWAQNFDYVIPIYNFFNNIKEANKDKNVKWIRVLPNLEIV